MMVQNADARVVRDFGREWETFDQGAVPSGELARLFGEYFSVFPWDQLPEHARGFDLGCGSGRWAKLVAPHVGEIHCVDASEAALEVAKSTLRDMGNAHFHLASVDALPFADASMDFGYSLGVLHHLPDTVAGVRSCAAKLKPGAPLLLYLYYRFDNRALWYRALWKASDAVRGLVSRLPHPLKLAMSQIIALLVYWPLARGALLLERFGFRVDSWPLAAYRHNSFYTMRTDSLDRFGTRLERRFTRAEIEAMMRSAGLRDIRFREESPYWCAVGLRDDGRS
jgi:SAM-dependent methyltransferase